MSGKQERLGRDAFGIFRTIPTRWHDNDVYGHVNNVVYYSWFDTAVNAWLIERGFLDIAGSATVGLVVETTCSYFESVAFPETVELGLGVERLGTSSVTYRIGVFREGGERAAAQGRFTHVHVDRATQRPVPIPAALRAALETLTSSGGSG
ncbi:MAG: thioesterase family protein [Bosea sp. (in: a-proteobacteria)]|uniref:acyl-CoA thioesterase n=1 Tax=Bosea sp. (in: a-proteobacteria) TaxID=1871050 RepID=UPI002735B0E3|nr:thioesterase family protein [Bosea sp. (in: a-proteobacteria)]MDP3255719.1 thioesterase family protein [Bosea sp. (in: a-proteobacteria)]MDP3319837.1 thioesterase family protein [Bosea sp. (in: a-proteobacteria)]